MGTASVPIWQLTFSSIEPGRRGAVVNDAMLQEQRTSPNLTLGAILIAVQWQTDTAHHTQLSITQSQLLRPSPHLMGRCM
jgi:hypothetical protein